MSNTNFFSANIGYQAIDRWGHWASGSSKFTVQQVVDAPPGFYYSLKVTSLANTTHGVSDGYTISQRVEAQNLYQASLGTANAKNLVVSFYVKSTATGTFSFYAMGYGLAESFVQNFTINSANTWEYKTINIPAPTSGTYSNTPSNYGLELGFTLGAGSNWQTSTLGSWQNSAFQISSTTATNVLGAASRTLQLTGVQLEVGTKATPFEHRKFSDELFKCQRYYCKINGGGNTAAFGMGMARGTDHTRTFIKFPTTMRAKPTAVETSGTAADYRILHRTSIDNSNNVPSFTNTASTEGATITFEISSGTMTQGDCVLCASTNADAFLAFSSEI